MTAGAYLDNTLDLKAETDGALRGYLGRLFQRCAYAIENENYPVLRGVLRQMNAVSGELQYRELRPFRRN